MNRFEIAAYVFDEAGRKFHKVYIVEAISYGDAEKRLRSELGNKLDKIVNIEEGTHDYIFDSDGHEGDLFYDVEYLDSGLQDPDGEDHGTDMFTALVLAGSVQDAIKKVFTSDDIEIISVKPSRVCAFLEAKFDSPTL